MKSKKVSGKRKTPEKKKHEKPAEKKQEQEKNIEQKVIEISPAEQEEDFEEESFEEFIPRMESISSRAPVLQRVEMPMAGENLEANVAASTPVDADNTADRQEQGARYPGGGSDALGYSSFVQQSTDERKYESEPRVNLTPIRENMKMPRQELINPFFDVSDDNPHTDGARGAWENPIEERK